MPVHKIRDLSRPESAPDNAEQLDLSVIVPIYNEEESLPHLFAALFPVLESMKCSYEVICIDDGSKDASVEVLRQQAEKTPQLKVIALRRNYGQTAAMMAGLDHASGECIVSLDADLQNDPKDIPALVAKLN